MTVKIEREDKSAQELRQLARRVKDGRVSQRLLAIAMVLEGMRRKVVAENCGMDRQKAVRLGSSLQCRGRRGVVQSTWRRDEAAAHIRSVGAVGDLGRGGS